MPLSVCSRTVQCGAAGAWFSPTSTPHPGSHTEHLKTSWQCFPSISSEDMPKSFSAARLTPVMRNSGIVQDQRVGKLVEHGFQNAGSLPPWGELGHAFELILNYSKRGLGQLAQCAAVSGGIAPNLAEGEQRQSGHDQKISGVAMQLLSSVLEASCPIENRFCPLPSCWADSWFATTASYGKPEYTKKTKKACTYCHAKISSDKDAMAKNLTDAGKYLRGAQEPGRLRREEVDRGKVEARSRP